MQKALIELALLQLTKLFPGVKKTKATVSDFLVVVAEVSVHLNHYLIYIHLQWHFW